MAAEKNDLLGLIDIAVGIAKDKAFADALSRVQAAQREYLIAEADENRSKARGVVEAIVKLDITTKKLEIEYRRIKTSLSPSAVARFDRLFDSLDAQRQALVQEKKSIGIAGNP